MNKRIRKYRDRWLIWRKIYGILFFGFGILSILSEFHEHRLLMMNLRPFSLNHYYTVGDILPTIPAIVFIILLYVAFGAYMIHEYREKKSLRNLLEG